MSMDRRSFIRTCTGTLATATASGSLIDRLASAGDLVSYTRTRLVDLDGKPIKASALSTAEAYFFHYPIKSAPGLLIKLGSAAVSTDLKSQSGDAYAWQGGVGPGKDIVAYSAICAHLMAYPKTDVTVISYQASQSDLAGRNGVITCCAHDSVYDPAKGAAVIHGPAAQPLAAIKLEYDPADDSLYATGVYGGNRIDEFIRAYKADLIRQFGRGAYKEPVDANVQTLLLSKYADTVLAC